MEGKKCWPQCLNEKLLETPNKTSPFTSFKMFSTKLLASYSLANPYSDFFFYSSTSIYLRISL